LTLYSLDGTTPEAGGCWVAPGAAVIGDVTLGFECSVWFGAVLRGDTERLSFGEGTNLQEHVVCHADPGFPLTVGEEVTVGHRAILHGCTVDDGALIGMGAIVLNGARVGAGALIGAGALVTEGREIPPGWLAVGSPAKPVRELSADEIGALRLSARRYREKMRRFRDGLSPA